MTLSAGQHVTFPHPKTGGTLHGVLTAPNPERSAWTAIHYHGRTVTVPEADLRTASRPGALKRDGWAVSINPHTGRYIAGHLDRLHKGTATITDRWDDTHTVPSATAFHLPARRGGFALGDRVTLNPQPPLPVDASQVDEDDEDRLLPPGTVIGRTTKSLTVSFAGRDVVTVPSYTATLAAPAVEGDWVVFPDGATGTVLGVYGDLADDDPEVSFEVRLSSGLERYASTRAGEVFEGFEVLDPSRLSLRSLGMG